MMIDGVPDVRAAEGVRSSLQPVATGVLRELAAGIS